MRPLTTNNGEGCCHDYADEVTMVALLCLVELNPAMVAARPGNAAQSRKVVGAQQKLLSGRRKIMAHQLGACCAKVLDEDRPGT
jgi:hypothetical protein